MSKAAAPSNQEPNKYGVRKVAMSRRVAKFSSPSPSVVSGGLVPGSDAPLVVSYRVEVVPTAYSASLEVELPRDRPRSCGLRLASFFCGAGGLDLGFRSAGFELAFASDYDQWAAATYAKNLGHEPVVGDIRAVDSASVPSVDVVAGGFPCVTFSTAGRRLGVVDDVNGQLYLELCRMIGAVRPRFFVAENVAGILTANGGAAVKMVLAAFLRLGYRTAYEVVNVAEHGVPQTRTRVIFVGVRVDEWRGSFRFPGKTHRLGEKDPRWLSPAVGVGLALGLKRGAVMMPSDTARKIRRGVFGQSRYSNTLPRSAAEAGVPIKASGPPVVSNCDANVKPISRGYATSSRVARAEAPAPTMVVAENLVPLIDGMRRMTARECARVQSFPDWFAFEGPTSAVYRQIGNAVPPLYAKRLGAAIVEYGAREKA